nr:hypothetical protein [Tanacetum cinerariifolium]
MYAKYLKEFWYTAKVENNIITFSLSHVEKPLSFNHDLFSSVIGLDYAKKFESLPSHEDLKEGLPTLGLTDEKSPNLSSVALSQSSPIRITYFSPTWKILMTYIVKCLGGNQGSHDVLNVNQQMIAYALCRDLKIDITCILFNDLVTKLSVGGRKGREKNVCYIRYMSIIMEHLLGKYYLNDDLKPMKSYQMTDARFKNSKMPKVPLTSHMRRIAQLLEKPLNPFSNSGLQDMGDVPLESFYDADERSLSKSETFESKEDDTHSQHIELSKSEERYADKLIEELADMNASAENPSLSDPFSHLCNEETVPELVAKTLKETLPELISERLKSAIPQIIYESLQQILEPINKQFQAYNKFEARRFVTLHIQLSKDLKKKLRVSIRKEEKNNLESPKSAADVDNAQEEQKSDDIAKVQEEQHFDNKSEDANENQKSAAEKVNTDNALIIHPLEEKPLEYEPPSKKPMFEIPKEILSLTHLNSIRPQFITPIIINMPQNQDSSILSKPADKGKAIATQEDPTRELIPLLEESGSSLKISKLKLFSSDGGQMTIKKAKAQIEELRKIKLLKAEKEKSDKELLKNKTMSNIRHLSWLSMKPRVKYLSAQESKSKDLVGIDSSWKEDIKVDGMHRNLIPPRGVIGSPGLVITKPEAGIFYYNGNFNLVFQRENEFHLASTTQLIKQLKHIKRNLQRHNKWSRSYSLQ